MRGKSIKGIKYEGQNVFNILSGIAIIILVKDSTNAHEIHYASIGPYLSREQKLNKLSSLKDISNIKFNSIIHDDYNDWINKKNSHYQYYSPLASKGGNSMFNNHTMEVQNNRDTWDYNFSVSKLSNNIKSLINQYNHERNYH